jgi:acyl-CoA synthetase (AMP-forming)/AMP-acid ligase II
MRPIDFFDRGAHRHPHRPFMIAEDDSVITHAEAVAISHRTALAMLATSYVRGRHAAIYSSNDPRAFHALLGIFRAGGAWVPINARSAVDEIAYILDYNDAEFLFFHSNFAANVRIIRERCPKIRTFVCLDRDDPGAVFLDTFTAPFDGTAPAFTDNSDDVCVVFPSGGTTGKPKGVLWTNRVMESMITAMSVHIAPVRNKPPVHLCSAPMTHAAGVVALTLMKFGATQVIMDDVKLPDLMENIQKYGVTHLFLPPTAIYVMLAHADVRRFNYTSLDYFIYAAAPMSVNKLREAIDVFGPVMTQTFGQAEAPMICTCLSPQAHVDAIENNRLDRLASCGQPAMLTAVEIMDDDDNILPTGERGEIVVRGNLVMKGYYKNPKATQKVTTPDGWHRTGDIGRKDDEEFVYIVDRKKDMIISGGFNVFPSEVEQVIWSHPSVQDCAVIGIPDNKWGEAVTAIVEKKPGGQVDENELIALCKAQLGSVKAPKTVRFWDYLPRSAVGKVLKKDIRDQFWRGLDRTI